MLAAAARATPDVALRPDAAKRGRRAPRRRRRARRRARRASSRRRTAAERDARRRRRRAVPRRRRRGARRSSSRTRSRRATSPARSRSLHRLLTAPSPQQPKPMHPLQIMGMLHGYYRRHRSGSTIPTIRDAGDAVAALGGRGEGVPGPQGARAGAGARHRRPPPGVRPPARQADLDLKGARGDPRGRGDGGARGAAGRARRRRSGAAAGPARAEPALARIARRSDVAALALHEARRAAGGLVLVDRRPWRRPCRGASAPGAPASPASSAPASMAAARRRFTRVFSSERTALLRRRRRSFWRFRLIWLLMFAMARAVTPTMRVRGPVRLAGVARVRRTAAIGENERRDRRSTASATFSIIAHVDHGKSTLADRSSSSPAPSTPGTCGRSTSTRWTSSASGASRSRPRTCASTGRTTSLHLIDTPGHVDFGYEVSRSLAACEGAILLVDASPGHRGPDARQLLPGDRARPHDRRRAEQDRPARGRARAASPRRSSGCSASRPTRSCASRPRPAKACPSCSTRSSSASRAPDGRRRRAAAGADLRLVLRPVPRRRRARCACSTARCVSGAALRFLQANATHDAEEIGVRLPVPTPVAALGPGRGRLPHRRHQGRRRGPGRRDGHRPRRVRAQPLPGYRDPKPMVFCGLYPVDGDEYADLREALEKLRLNDSSFTYEPETSGALGFGFRCGFLGLLHMEIVRERLEREYDLSLVATAPNVEYLAHLTDGARRGRRQPVGDAAARTTIEAIEEPFVNVTILTPTEYVGTLMELAPAAAGRDEEDGVPLGGARRARLRDPARRDRHRLLRPAEVAHARLREPRLRARGLPRVEPREGRRAAQQRAGRRVLDDRAPRQGVRLRAPHDREAARADPAPAVRRADPGRDRRSHHRPRDGEGEAQGRASPSATAATSPASASCSSARRRARSG